MPFSEDYPGPDGVLVWRESEACAWKALLLRVTPLVGERGSRDVCPLGKVVQHEGVVLYCVNPSAHPIVKRHIDGLDGPQYRLTWTRACNAAGGRDEM